MPRGVEGRIVGDTRQTGTLRQRQIPYVLAEIILSCGLDAVAAVSHIYLVEIPGKQVLPLIIFRQIKGGKYLPNLPGDGDIIVLRHVFDELLGDSGAALNVPACKHPQNTVGGALPVHAVVLSKAFVFNSNKGVYQILWDVIIVHPLPVLSAHQSLKLLPLPGLLVLIVDN